MLEVYQVYTLRVIDENYKQISEANSAKLIEKYEKVLENKYVVVEYRNGAYIIKKNHDIYYATLALGVSTINIVIENDIDIIINSITKRLKKEVLNPMMAAFLYFELLEIGKMRQFEIAKELTKTQGAISNKLRLLKLPIYVQEKIVTNEIKERHGRALLQLLNTENYEIIASKIAYKITKDNLKVVEVEDIINSILGKKVKIRNAVNIEPIDNRTDLKNPASGMVIEKLNTEIEKANNEIAMLFPLIDIELIHGLDGEDYVFILKLKGINNG